jgi:hypothetical protein
MLTIDFIFLSLDDGPCAFCVQVERQTQVVKQVELDIAAVSFGVETL